MGGDYDVAFTDGSKLEGGETGSGWTFRNQFCGGRGLGNRAKVWDAEVTAVAETLRLSKGKRLLILSDSQAAIAAVVKADRKGQGRTKELSLATNRIARRCRNDHTVVCLGWDKSHIGVEGNEAADKEAKGAAEGKGLLERTGRVSLLRRKTPRQRGGARTVTVNFF